MRLHFKLSPNRGPVPFEYPHFLAGTFHRWLGPNLHHDGLSLYSLGWLQGGQMKNGALDFRQGATWFLSFPDTTTGEELLNAAVNGAMKAPEVCCGMEVIESFAEKTPEFGSKRTFRANSPILVYGPKTPDKEPHLRYDDPLADEILTRVLRQKMIAAGLEEHAQNATVHFDRSFQSPKTRLIHLKDGFKKRANVCPVVVSGNETAVRFAWNVGAGHLTGNGFGSLV